MDMPRRRVAATPRVRRGHSVAAGWTARAATGTRRTDRARFPGVGTRTTPVIQRCKRQSEFISPKARSKRTSSPAEISSTRRGVRDGIAEPDDVRILKQRVAPGLDDGVDRRDLEPHHPHEREVAVHLRDVLRSRAFVLCFCGGGTKVTPAVQRCKNQPKRALSRLRRRLSAPPRYGRGRLRQVSQRVVVEAREPQRLHAPRRRGVRREDERGPARGRHGPASNVSPKFSTARSGTRPRARGAQRSTRPGVDASASATSPPALRHEHAKFATRSSVPWFVAMTTTVLCRAARRRDLMSASTFFSRSGADAPNRAVASNASRSECFFGRVSCCAMTRLRPFNRSGAYLL